MKRHKISKKLSRKIFKKGVNKTKKVNVMPRPMRGGFRI